MQLKVLKLEATLFRLKINSNNRNNKINSKHQIRKTRFQIKKIPTFSLRIQRKMMMPHLPRSISIQQMKPGDSIPRLNAKRCSMLILSICMHVLGLPRFGSTIKRIWRMPRNFWSLFRNKTLHFWKQRYTFCTAINFRVLCTKTMIWQFNNMKLHQILSPKTLNAI